MTATPRRVAITGLGLVTPVGNDVATTWSALLAGRSGVAPITHFDASGFPARIAAEVKGFDPRRAIDDRKLLKFANRSHASRSPRPSRRCAMPASGPTAGDATRWGCVVGTGMMGLGFDELGEVHRHCAPDGALPPGAPADRRLRDRSPGLLPQPDLRRAGPLAPPVRHPRLRDVGAHRLRLGRPGGRHGHEADPARHRRPRARRAASTR